MKDGEAKQFVAGLRSWSIHLCYIFAIIAVVLGMQSRKAWILKDQCWSPPTEINLVDLTRYGAPDGNRYVKVINYEYSSNFVKETTSSKAGKIWILLTSKNRNGKQAAVDNKIYCAVLRTNRYKTTEDIDKYFNTTASITGMAVNDIDSLSKSEVDDLTKNIGQADYANMPLIDDRDDPPTAKTACIYGGIALLFSTLSIIGTALFLIQFRKKAFQS